MLENIYFFIFCAFIFSRGVSYIRVQLTINSTFPQRFRILLGLSCCFFTAFFLSLQKKACLASGQWLTGVINDSPRRPVRKMKRFRKKWEMKFRYKSGTQFFAFRNALNKNVGYSRCSRLSTWWRGRSGFLFESNVRDIVQGKVFFFKENEWTTEHWCTVNAILL